MSLESALVVGSGSIGRRHMRNLRQLGMSRIAACDTDAERLAPMIQELKVESFSDYEKALGAVKPQAVLICTPPSLHVRQALAAARAGAHVFIEKPVSHSMEGMAELASAAEKHKVVVQVGYNMRFHAGIRELHRIMRENVIGRILWARAEVGQYLPDWRPWQDYRQSYTARRALGGGILLDGSHEIDYMLWMLGRPIDVRCLSGKVSKLEMDVEDCATVLLRFASGAQADIHLDCVQRTASRSCKLVGENGTAEWDAGTEKVRVRLAGEDHWRETPAPENDTYLEEMKDFLLCIRESRRPLVGLEDGRNALAVVLAAKGEAVTFA